MRPRGCVGTIGIVLERKGTDGCVVAADCGAIAAPIAHRGITEGSRQAEEGIGTLSSVEVPIASAWWRKNRSSCWRKRKAGERERDESQGGGGTWKGARKHVSSWPLN